MLFFGFWNKLSVITGYKFKREQQGIPVRYRDNVAQNILNKDIITYDELDEYVPQTLFNPFTELFEAQSKDNKSFKAVCSMQNKNFKPLSFKPLSKKDQKSFIKDFCAECHANCQLKGKEKASCFRAVGEKLMRSYQSYYYGKAKEQKEDLNKILDTIQAEAAQHSNQTT
ncbi:MAG TPA: hypothetical protein VL201_03865 [Patescibacteria group bacterium]|jgi:hypothetical protein|nr:hypothetical protein [Patescibacteria group bacterium]